MAITVMRLVGASDKWDSVLSWEGINQAVKIAFIQILVYK